VDKDAENGRGLHVVSQLAARWGARRTHSGKVVWCEQTVPEAVKEALAAASVAPVAAPAMPDEVSPLEALAAEAEALALPG
jgi:hypothetical protein